MRNRTNTFYRHGAKRTLDALAAIGLLVLLTPLFLLLAAAVRSFLGTPVYFRQVRPGKHGRLFALYKFRTMANHRDAKGRLLPDDRRLTRFGRWLRSTSLDELPSLWNVLRGDMSLVGPRPLLVEYLERYSDEQAKRHDVKPGLTGWAQIHGRNAISWERKFLYDCEYVERLSFWLDVHIMVRTLWTVCSRRGIGAERHVTMPRFQASASDERQTNQAAHTGSYDNGELRLTM